MNKTCVPFFQVTPDTLMKGTGKPMEWQVWEPGESFGKASVDQWRGICRVSLLGFEPNPNTEHLWGFNRLHFPFWAFPFSPIKWEYWEILPHHMIVKIKCNNMGKFIAESLGNSKCLTNIIINAPFKKYKLPEKAGEKASFSHMTLISGSQEQGKWPDFDSFQNTGRISICPC